MTKGLISSIREIRTKQLNEFLDSKGNPKDPKELGSFSTNNQSPYGFAQGGSEEDTQGNYWASVKRMQDAQAAAPAPEAPKPKAAPKPAPVPLPPRRPAELDKPSQTTSQSSSGNGDILGGKTAAPVAPAKTGEEGIKKADEIANRTDAIEKTMRDPKPVGEKPSPANVIGADRNAGSKTGVTPRTLGVVAGATGGNAADEKARESMSSGQKSDIDAQAAKRQAEINAEREKNLAAQAEKRRKLQNRSQQNVFNEDEKASGSKGKKNMSESLINAFLKLQNDKSGNIFEAAKKAKKDYDGDGKVESPKDEVWGSRFKAAKEAGKMEEAASQLDPENKAIKPAKTTDPDFAAPSANPDAPKSPIQFTPKKEEPKKTNEEVSFSEEELAHIAAIMEAEPVAKTPQDYSGPKNGPSVRDLTDETELEEAKRGRKAGVKVGSYKRKDVSGAETEQKGTPHILDQIRDTKEDERGNVTLTHPDTGKKTQVHRSVARGFYTDYHNTEKPVNKQQKYADFLGKHFGGGSSAPAQSSKGVSLGTMKGK